jgi:nucleotide-binding universal stress UspA family protein
MTEWTRIVVAVDGSEHSQRALRWASEEADHHNADLLAVSVWTPPPPTIDPPFGGFPWRADANREEHAKAMLERAVRKVFQDDPQSYLQTQITEGNAAKVLIDLSREADLCRDPWFPSARSGDHQRPNLASVAALAADRLAQARHRSGD